jgi:hypothetical protein
LVVQPALACVAQHRPHAGDAVALMDVGDLTRKLAGSQMHQEVHSILAAEHARIIPCVGAQTEHVGEFDRDVRVEPQKPNAVRHQPLLVPLLDQLAQP